MPSTVLIFEFQIKKIFKIVFLVIVTTPLKFGSQKVLKSQKIKISFFLKNKCIPAVDARLEA